MATLRQKKLAEGIIENAKKGTKLNKKDLLVSVGYAINTAEVKATEIIEQKGVQEELESLGFDFESAKKVVTSILKKGKEENRLKAAQEIFKVTGAYAPEKHIVASMGEVLDQLENYGQTPTQQDLEDK